MIFKKQTGEPVEEPEEEEEEPEEDSPPGSQKREFQQVTKSEPKGISAWGLRHPLLLVEIYPYTTGIGGKRQGTCVLEATKIGPNLIGNIATRSAGPKSVGGAAPASAVAGSFYLLLTLATGRNPDFLDDDFRRKNIFLKIFTQNY